jgi:hypothetical protein
MAYKASLIASYFTSVVLGLYVPQLHSFSRIIVYSAS